MFLSSVKKGSSVSRAFSTAPKSVKRDVSLSFMEVFGSASLLSLLSEPKTSAKLRLAPPISSSIFRIAVWPRSHQQLKDSL